MAKQALWQDFGFRTLAGPLKFSSQVFWAGYSVDSAGVEGDFVLRKLHVLGWCVCPVVAPYHHTRLAWNALHVVEVNDGE